MQTEHELLKLARDYRQLANQADAATAFNLMMLADDFEGHAQMLAADARSRAH